MRIQKKSKEWHTDGFPIFLVCMLVGVLSFVAGPILLIGWLSVPLIITLPLILGTLAASIAGCNYGVSLRDGKRDRVTLPYIAVMSDVSGRELDIRENMSELEKVLSDMEEDDPDRAIVAGKVDELEIALKYLRDDDLNKRKAKAIQSSDKVTQRELGE